MNEALSIVTLVLRILAPIAEAMIAALQRGEDPLDVLVKERVQNIIPNPLRLELLMAAAKARGVPTPQ
jgi:hypothetical protein